VTGRGPEADNGKSDDESPRRAQHLRRSSREDTKRILNPAEEIPVRLAPVCALI
jgi:hypothetical protein